MLKISIKDSAEYFISLCRTHLKTTFSLAQTSSSSQNTYVHKGEQQ